ncbi:MAG: entericidin A/B family lipoprotein [Paracoccaceae bacterium]
MLARFLTVAAIFGLTACETVEGFGQDVSSGGQAIQ